MFDFQRKFYLSKIKRAFDLRVIPSEEFRRLIKSDAKLKQTFIDLAIVEIQLTDDFDQWFGISPCHYASNASPNTTKAPSTSPNASFTSELKLILQNEFCIKNKNDAAFDVSLSSYLETESSFIKNIDFDSAKFWTEETKRNPKNTRNTKSRTRNIISRLTIISLVCILSGAFICLSNIIFRSVSDKSENEKGQIASKISDSCSNNFQSVDPQVISPTTNEILSAEIVNPTRIQNGSTEKRADVTAYQNPLLPIEEDALFTGQQFSLFSFPLLSSEIISFIMTEKEKNFFQTDSPIEEDLDTNSLLSYAMDLYISPLFFDTTN